MLKGLTLKVPLGQHVAILGPNGCGKSTLIKLITRELYADPNVRGSWVEILGQRRWNIFDLRPLLGIVSYDWLETCRRNDYPCTEIVLSGFFASVGIWPNHTVTAAMRKRVREVMRLLEIEHLARRPINELSSGEGRRVLIGRALVNRPKALVLDEPANSLDLGAMHELRETMQRVAAHGTSIILVTHHLTDIIPEIDRVVLLAEGRAFFDGPKRQALTPAKLGELFGVPVAVGHHAGYYHAW